MCGWAVRGVVPGPEVRDKGSGPASGHTPSSPGDSVPCTPMHSAQRNLEAGPEEFLPEVGRASLETPFTL